MNNLKSTSSSPPDRSTIGFTLLEMSIAMVIIGLLIAGIFAGRELINAAEIRGAVAQIEEIEAQVMVFKGKYGELPGDGKLGRFGIFATRTGAAGHGDGNRIIGNTYAATWMTEICGESLLFWSDLAAAGYRSDVANIALDPINANSCVPNTITPDDTLSSYLPRSRFAGNYIAIYSHGGAPAPNTYAIGAIKSITTSGTSTTIATIPAASALAFDTKMDDGLPTTGKVSSLGITTYGGSPAPVAWGAGGSGTCYTGTAYYTGSGYNCMLGVKSRF